jgi:Cu(I)/Ag(I) efflux system membrane fusion protein
MQFSPYRVQLAGIRTASVEYRVVRREVVLVGTVAKADSASVSVEAEVFEKDLPFLTEGRAVEGTTNLLPGHLPFTGEIAAVESNSLPGSRSFRVRLRIDDPDRELRQGTLMTARLEVPIMRLPWWRRATAEERSNRTAIETAARSLLPAAGLIGPGDPELLVRKAVVEAFTSQGMGLAVPHSAVVDHGSRKLAFVENGPGMFDAVEIAVGPRCGDYYPVLRGVENGQRVAVAGAFLLDAEMWLNHGVAASYFGATRGASAAPAVARPPAVPSPRQDESPLSPEDHILAARQKTCPVTDEPLDSMGGPIRVEVAGRVVFICCKGCAAPLRKSPEKYLAKLPAK